MAKKRDALAEAIQRWMDEQEANREKSAAETEAFIARLLTGSSSAIASTTEHTSEHTTESEKE